MNSIWRHVDGRPGLTRREVLGILATGGAIAFTGPWIYRRWKARRLRAETFIAQVPGYNVDIVGAIRSGFRELGITQEEIKDKIILLKPNLVETHSGAEHINTHPQVVRAAIEAFKAYGARDVFVAEGPGHCRDSLRLLHESGLIEILREDRIPYVDLNSDEILLVKNKSKRSKLKKLIIPETIQKADWVVSLAKMKTHHWAGVTLSMKNLFGVMPGRYYGWPKNVLHCAGIHETILDIYANLRPHFAIVDGIVGMEGDGPIMGVPHKVGALVMGRNFPAVDATCARIMGINPHKVPYLAAADGWLGTIRELNIKQKGEKIAALQSKFELCDNIPAQQGIGRD